MTTMKTNDLFGRHLMSLNHIKFYCAVNGNGEYVNEYESVAEDFSLALVQRSVYFFRYVLKLNEKVYKIRELTQDEYLIYNSWVFQNIVTKN